MALTLTDNQTWEWGNEAMRRVPYRERKEDFVKQSVGLFSLWKLEQSNSKNHYNLTRLFCLFWKWNIFTAGYFQPSASVLLQKELDYMNLWLINLG